MPDLPFSGGTTKMVALLLMNERYVRWYTPWLSREFEMLVFGDKRGLLLVLFPTSEARSKGIKHWLDDRRWRGHDWNYWQDMLPVYLSLL